ncbi:MAG: hypothetical protein ACK4LQ_01160 [Pararhodobacter sp.]
MKPIPCPAFALTEDLRTIRRIETALNRLERSRHRRPELTHLAEYFRSLLAN